jgi:hypothetical protein
MLGENPIEPVQQIKFFRRRRPRLIIEAAARDPEQRALPDYGQPNLAQSSPASQQTGDGGLPGKKIAFDLQLADFVVQIIDHLLRILGRRRLAAAREQFARSLHQLLLPGADHGRVNPEFRRQFRQGLLPGKCRHRHARLEVRAVLLPLHTHVSRLFWTGQPLAYPTGPKITGGTFHQAAFGCSSTSYPRIPEFPDERPGHSILAPLIEMGGTEFLERRVVGE